MTQQPIQPRHYRIFKQVNALFFENTNSIEILSMNAGEHDQKTQVAVNVVFKYLDHPEELSIRIHDTDDISDVLVKLVFALYQHGIKVGETQYKKKMQDIVDEINLPE